MARLKKEERKNQDLVYSNNVYYRHPKLKRFVKRKNVNALGKIRLDTPIAILDMNAKREVFKDNLSALTDATMTKLFKEIDKNNSLEDKRQKKKYVYLIKK